LADVLANEVVIFRVNGPQMASGCGSEGESVRLPSRHDGLKSGHRRLARQGGNRWPPWTLGSPIKPDAGEADAFKTLGMNVTVIVKKPAVAGTDGFEQRVSGRKAADAPAISFLREHAEVAA